MGVIEGKATPLFVRMATRAGSLFDENESHYIKSRVVSEIQGREKGHCCITPLYQLSNAGMSIFGWRPEDDDGEAEVPDQELGRLQRGVGPTGLDHAVDRRGDLHAVVRQ